MDNFLKLAWVESKETFLKWATLSPFFYILAGAVIPRKIGIALTNDYWLETILTVYILILLWLLRGTKKLFLFSLHELIAHISYYGRVINGSVNVAISIGKSEKRELFCNVFLKLIKFSIIFALFMFVIYQGIETRELDTQVSLLEHQVKQLKRKLSLLSDN